MKRANSRDRGHRFPAEITSYAVWVYNRFCIGLRDVEDFIAQRGILVLRSDTRLVPKVWSGHARNLDDGRGVWTKADSWKKSSFASTARNLIYGERRIRVGDVVDILVQSRRDQ